MAFNDDPEANNTLRLLSQSEKGYIGRCTCCKHFSFAWQNMLFTFSENDLKGFHQVLYNENHFHQLRQPLPNGKRLLLQSPIPNLTLTFDNQELEEIKNLFQEALLTLEIDKIFAYEK